RARYLQERSIAQIAIFLMDRQLVACGVTSDMVGTRIRQARAARGMSLTDVATRADISVATLSRIERDKQNIDVGTFLTLMRILEVHPGELLDHEEAGTIEGVDPLVAKIIGLQSVERAKLWRALADHDG